MSAFSQINWDDPDIWGILVGRGIATVEAQTSAACDAWLERNGYEILEFSFANGISPVVAQLGEFFHWEEQFGYRLESTSRNLAALRDGFDVESATAFGLTYLSVLGAFAAACALLWVACFVALGFIHAPSARATLQSVSHKALVSLAIFAVAMLAAPLFELALPLKRGPMCANLALPRGN